ncbi:hypothetical protein NM688_g3161 [Phlebia brevispora]|uniref:Uncharacterized protein n=1 Tax=Phlebia brevispora TaxID=194682 RepID=A0ACC1T6P6_9APHY|nr:hypothetical protein NM688_g3161 [Phlebia brevispora]
MPTSFSKQNAAALFSQLILENSGDAYPNWHPSTKIKVGDFGILDEQTSEFHRQGSIYDKNFVPGFNISRDHPPEKRTREDSIQYVSRGTAVQSFGASLHAFSKLTNAKLTGHWVFEEGYGAVLMLYKPTETVIRNKAILMDRLEGNTTLAGKVVITSVFSCPTYAQLLIRDKKSKVDIAISLSVRNESTGFTSMQWHSSNSAEALRTGGENGRSKFYPLYTLRSLLPADSRKQDATSSEKVSPPSAKELQKKTSFLSRFGLQRHAESA